MKLSTILILSFIAIILIGIFSTAYFRYLSTDEMLTNIAHNHLTSTSKIIENNIETFLDGQEHKIELIATQSELTNEELLGMLKLDDSFYDLFVIDSTGKVIVSSNPARIGLDRANRTYFSEARNQTYLNPVYFALVPQEYSISVSTPFHGGVLVGAMKLGALNKIVSERTGLGETGESLLAFIDENEEVVYFSERRFSNQSLEILSKEQVQTRPIYRALLKEETLIDGLKDYRDVEVISVTNYIDKIGVGMVTKIDTEEALGAARKEALRDSLNLGIMSLILGSIIAFFLSLFISKPIKKLKNNVDEITRGKLEIQLNKSSIYEIQNLTDSLNRILASLKLAILRSGTSKADIGLGEAVKAKEEAENKYRLLYETSNDAIMTLEPPTWNFTSGNPATIKMFNVKDEEQLVSLNPGELSPEKQPDGQLSSAKAKKMIERAMKNGSNFFEWTHKRYKGESFPATVLLSRVKEGDKTYLQATVREISKENMIKMGEETMKLIEKNITKKKKKQKESQNEK